MNYFNEKYNERAMKGIPSKPRKKRVFKQNKAILMKNEALKECLKSEKKRSSY